MRAKNLFTLFVLVVMAFSLVACGGLFGSTLDSTPAPTQPVDPQVTQPVDPQVTPTPMPVTPTPFVSLNYDETNNDALTAGQTQLLALILRPAFDKGQAELEAAIGSIQTEAANTGATVMQGCNIEIPENQAFLVWHSDGETNGVVTNIPADASDVFTTHNSGSGMVWVVGPFAPPVPDRTHRTFQCSSGSFWAVAIH